MLNIHLLDRLRVDNDHAPLKLPNLRKTAPLWAYLLLHRGPMPRTTLCHVLWPDEGETSARANLRRHLHQLRQALPPTSPAKAWLLVTPDYVQWNPESDYWLDTDAFEQASGQIEEVEKAAALYEGELLPELDDDWVTVWRTRLHNLYLADLKQLVSRARMTTDYIAALGYAQLLLLAAPLDESALRLLMTIRYEAGDRSGAIAEYEQFVQLLRRELDVEAMPETVALHQAILNNTRLAGSIPDVERSRISEGRTQRATLPFVGREREFEWLRARWARAAVGAGSLVLVGGEAGIGKTRLITELSHTAQAEGARLLYGYTTFPEPTPYQAIITALRAATTLFASSEGGRAMLSALLPLLPELAFQRPTLGPLPRLEPERERDRLYVALHQCLVALAEPRPLLLILEDLHWAGAATLSFLRYLWPALRRQPILLIATYREEETGRRHPLRELRQELINQGHGDQQLVLTRLPEAAAVQALSRVEGLAGIDGAMLARFVQESEGNPLFLGELISNLREAQVAGQPVGTAGGDGTPLPVSIRRVVVERTSRLATNTRVVAEIAAVVGTAFNVELVREVAGLEESQVLTALDEMLDHAIIREGGGSANYDYSFTHHLIQESIYEDIEDDVRRRRHRRLGLVLEDLYPERRSELAGDLARHFDRGADAVRAVAYYLIAIDNAAAVYADEEALEMVARVLALSDDPQARGQSLCVSESIHQRQGNRQAQEAILALMESLAEDQVDAELIFDVLRRRIAFYNVLGQREQQADLIVVLMHRAQASGKQDWLAAALTEQANLYLQLSQYHKVRELVGQALALYQEQNNKRAEVECYCLLIDCFVHLGQFDEARELVARASTLSTPNDRALVAKVLTAAAKAAVIQNRFSEARQLGQQLLDLSQAIQDREGEALALSVIATSAASTTWAEEAFDYFEKARALSATLGKRSGEAGALSNAGAFAVHVGRYEYGTRLLREAEIIYQDLNSTRGRVVCLINLGIAQVRQGAPALAIATGTRGLELARVMNSPYLEAALLVNMGHAALELGAMTEAISYLETALAHQREIELWREMITSLSHLTIAYLREGNVTAAEQVSAEAIQLYETNLLPNLIKPDYPQYIYWSAACLERSLGHYPLAEQHISVAQVLLDQELATFADAAARDAYRAIDFNRSLLAAAAEAQRVADERAKDTAAMPACPRCQQATVVIRAGLNHTRSQRYRCLTCQRYFTVQRREHGYSDYTKRRAVQLAHEGKSSRAIARELGVNYRSVINWTKLDNSSQSG